MNYLGVSSRGWTSVASASAALMAGTGAAIATFGVFMPWLVKEFGWARGEVSLGLSVCFVLQTVFAPVAGFLVAKYGARKSIAAGNILIVLACLMLGLMHSFWQFLAAYALIGVGFGSCGIVAGSTIATNWFGDKSTMAMGIISSSIGVGAMILVPLASMLILNIGWRDVYFAIAALIFLVGVLIPLTAIKDRPEDLKTSDRGAGRSVAKATVHGSHKVKDAAAASLTLKQALSTGEFWLITAFFATQMFVYSFFLTHQVAYLTGSGMSSQTAATTLGVVSASSVVGNLLAGTFSLRFSLRSLSACAAVIVICSTVISFFMHSAPLAFLFSLAFGIGHGAAVVCILSMYAVYFGKAHFPEIFGVSSLLRIAGTAGGPVGGYLFDAQGTYFMAQLVMVAVACAGFVIAITLRRPLAVRSSAVVSSPEPVA